MKTDSEAEVTQILDSAQGIRRKLVLHLVAIPFAFGIAWFAAWLGVTTPAVAGAIVGALFGFLAVATMSQNQAAYFVPRHNRPVPEELDHPYTSGRYTDEKHKTVNTAALALGVVGALLAWIGSLVVRWLGVGSDDVRMYVALSATTGVAAYVITALPSLYVNYRAALSRKTASTR